MGFRNLTGRTRAAALTLLLSLFLASPVLASQHQDPTGAPVKAVFAEGRLWVLSDRGDLTSFADGDAAPRAETGQDVLRLCLQNGAPLAVLGRYGVERAWRLRRHGSEGWTDFATVKAGKEHLNGVACTEDAVTLFAAKRNVRVDATGQRSTNFRFVRGAFEAGESTTSVLATPAALYVSHDEGSVGGVLRVDPATGEAGPIVGRGKGRCGGELAGRCDPVQAIAPSPNDGCLVVAMGLLTTPTAGRVLEVCGEIVRQIYARPAAGEASVPFIDIALAGQSLWLSGGDGLTRLTGDKVEVVGVPPMKTVGPYRVTFALPGVVAVGSPSGALLLAPR